MDRARRGPVRGHDERLLRVGSAAVLLGLLAWVPAPAAAASLQECYDLHCVIEDGEGLPLAALVTLIGSDSLAHGPTSDSCCYYNSGSYFYADGWFDAAIPGGSTRLFVSKGFEYESFKKILDIVSDTTLVVVLERWIDVGQEGWYSGDPHVHLVHQASEGKSGGAREDPGPEVGYLAASAVGLNVIHYLDNERFFTGAPDPVSSPECIVYFSEEYRSFCFGHLVLLGLDELLYPMTTGPKPAWPMNLTVLQALRAQSNVAASYGHPLSSYTVRDTTLWPGGGMARELPIDALDGLVEALDVFAYTNAKKVSRHWYALLNSRIKIWGSAGTDAVVNRPTGPPPGGFRLYVNLGDSVLSYEAWVAGFRDGRSFFTNAPLFREFEFGDVGIGDSLIFAGDAPTWVEGHLSFGSLYPVEFVDILWNGEVSTSFTPVGEGPQMLDTTFSVLVDETGWIAARARGKNLWKRFVVSDSLIAHTNPIFVRFGQDELYSDSDLWVSWLDTVVLYLDRNGEWDDPADSIFVYDKIAQARAYYQSVSNQAPSRPCLRVPQDGATVGSLTPVLDWQTADDPDSGDTVYYTVWYGTDSTFAVKTAVESLLVSECGVADPLEDSTLYFWRVLAQDIAGHEVWSDDPECPGYPDIPCGWRFTTAFDSSVCTTSVAEAETDGPRDLFAAYPNPFNPGTTVVYRLLEASSVSLRVYDVEGRLRAVLFKGPQPAGVHRLSWNGRDEHGQACGPGVYFCRLDAGRERRTRKIVLLE